MDRTERLAEEAYRACDPREPLHVSDPRNIDLDSEGSSSPRGIRWAHRIGKEIRFSAEPVRKLFSGLPGSGKSTELRRLLNGLETDGYVTVLIDADVELDLASAIAVPELVAVVVQAVERALLSAEKKDPDEVFSRGYGRRLWDFLSNTEITPEKVNASKDPVRLTAALKTNPVLREQFRSVLKPRLTEFLAEARTYIDGLQVRAKELGRNGIVVVLDSLEKLRGPTDGWDEVIDRAERVFGHEAQLLELPLHAIYTVPTALLSRQLGVEFMPAVKVRSRDGDEYGPGVRVLLELIRLRLSDETRQLLFGDEPGQTQLLERVIRNSGGYLRNILRTLQIVALADEHPVDAAHVEWVFQQQVDEYKRLVTKADYVLLQSIAREKEMILRDGSPQTRKQAEHLLTNSVVLRYQNTNDWFDLHPAVRELPGLKRQLVED